MKGKRMDDGWKKTGPEQQGPGPVRVHSPALPGYPSLGCSSAVPNSVSPGNMKHNLEKVVSELKTSQTRPPGTGQNDGRKILLTVPWQRHSART